MRNISLYIFISLLLFGCDSYDTHQPFDIIKGKQDIQTAYYENTFINPVTITGYVLDRKSDDPVSKAKVTLRLQNSETYYTTVTKDDGSFILYGENSLEYSLYAEKDGYDKRYFTTYGENSKDTTFAAGSQYNVTIKLKRPSAIPVFKVQYVSSVDSELWYAVDLGFDGTNVMAISTYDDYAYYYNTSGTAFKAINFPTGYYSVGCKGTEMFYASAGGSWIYAINPKTATVSSNISTGINPVNDVEVYGNNFWVISQNSFAKLASDGTVIENFKFDNYDYVTGTYGLTQKGNFLYVLTIDDDDYVLYKFDPKNVTIVGRAELPYSIRDMAITSIAFDKTNLWALSSVTGELLKFNVTE